MSSSLVTVLYLAATLGFVRGLKLLASPRTAKRGIWIAAAGMTLAVLATILPWSDGAGGILRQTKNLTAILVALGAGGLAGWVLAEKIRMTAMPQLVAAFNGFGGLASALVTLGEVHHVPAGDPARAAVAVFSVLVGGVTFTGSLVAYGKLQGLLEGAPITFAFQKSANALLLLVAVLLGVLAAGAPGGVVWIWLAVPIALVLGVLATIPIGGADMPVVIAMLNALSGVAAASAGFMTHNLILITAGALVGASGVILSAIMCRGMNRSLGHVLFAAFGTGDSPSAVAAGPQGSVAHRTPEDGAVLLTSAQRVLVVPGYGLAASQAQHALRELADLLGARGVEVRYAIHPVAGRMPGHMNVLLAEANVPYDHLLDLDQANPLFDRTDVALVVGANDVVNPRARTDTSAPIYGMPILDADHARHVIFLKRSLSTGFAGLDNPLFFQEKTMMLFGDARQTLESLGRELKAL